MMVGDCECAPVFSLTEADGTPILRVQMTERIEIGEETDG
jgi:hypothetical protein